MLPKRLRTLFPAYDIFFFALTFFMLGASTCSKGPKVSVYISNAARGGMDFMNEATGEKGFVAYPQTDKYVCLSPQDAETLLNYCNATKSSPAPQ